jgi:hypothetical protein
MRCRITDAAASMEMTTASADRPTTRTGMGTSALEGQLRPTAAIRNAQIGREGPFHPVLAKQHTAAERVGQKFGAIGVRPKAT